MTAPVDGISGHVDGSADSTKCDFHCTVTLIVFLAYRSQDTDVHMQAAD